MHLTVTNAIFLNHKDHSKLSVHVHKYGQQKVFFTTQRVSQNTSVYVCVCMYVCMCVYVGMCVCVYIYICLYVCRCTIENGLFFYVCWLVFLQIL